MTTVTAGIEDAAQSEASRTMLAQLVKARNSEKRRRLLWAILTPITLLLLWEGCSRVGLLDANFFPAPSMILMTSGQHLTQSALRNDLLANMQASGMRLGVGFVLGTLSGLAVGLLMGLIAPVRYALSAIINATYPLPKLTLFPLMIVFFGIGNTSMVALVTLGVFFMVTINTISGVVYSSPIYRDVAQAFQVPRAVRLLRVTIPAAVPSVLGGLRLGFGQALIIVVSTEFVSGRNGVGYMIWNSWQVLDVSAMFVGLAIIGVAGWLGSLVLTTVARFAVPWQDD